MADREPALEDILQFMQELERQWHDARQRTSEERAQLRGQRQVTIRYANMEVS